MTHLKCLLSQWAPFLYMTWQVLANERRRYIFHYGDVIMDAIASQISSLTIVYSVVYSDADQRKHQSYASLAFVRGIHRGPMISPLKWPVTRKMFPFDDVIMDVFSQATDSEWALDLEEKYTVVWLSWSGLSSSQLVLDIIQGAASCYTASYVIIYIYI